MPSWPELILLIALLQAVYIIKLKSADRRFRRQLLAYCTCLAGLNNVLLHYQPDSQGAYVGLHELCSQSKTLYIGILRACNWGAVAVQLSNDGLLITSHGHFLDSLPFSSALTPELVEQTILAAILEPAGR